MYLVTLKASRYTIEGRGVKEVGRNLKENESPEDGRKSGKSCTAKLPQEYSWNYVATKIN